MKFKFVFVWLWLSPVAPVFAAIIGTNIPATPLTAERVAALPAWKAYLEASRRQHQAEVDFFSAELQAHGLKQGMLPPPGARARNEDLNNSPDWYAGDEARRMADNIVSFQTPAGGWSMNTDFTQHPRAAGEMFAAPSATPNASSNTVEADSIRNDFSTFHNAATTTEMRFLAKVIGASKNGGDHWEKAFFHGLDYIFAAQYPNGGWPQIWPLTGGYHDAVTMNDNAMPHILELLLDVANGQDEFSFVPPATRARAQASLQAGVKCLLAAQVVVAGNRTAWCQQFDALTLTPASGRNYEMPALAASESGAVVAFLLRLPQPDTNTVAAVHAACAWLKKTKIAGSDYTYQQTPEGRKLVAVPGNTVRWARECQIGTDKPIFGDRDRTIHDDLNDLSKDRRSGYAWFRDTPQLVLEQYARWAVVHPPAGSDPARK